MKKRDESMNLFGAVRWMYSYVKVYKKWLILGTISSVTLILSNIFKAFYTQEIVNNALEGQFKDMISVLIIFVVIVITTVVSQYLSKYSTGKYALYATRDMKEKLSLHITKIKLEKSQFNQSGDLASRLNNDAEHITNFMKNDFLNVVLNPAMGLVAFVYILIIDWRLLLVSLVSVPLLMYASSFLSKKMGDLFPKSYEYIGEASSVVEESILGIDMLKTYNLEESTKKKAEKYYRKNFKTELEIYKFLAPMQSVGMSLAWLPRLTCALYGGYMALNGELQVGTLVSVLQLLEYIAFPTAGFAWILGIVKRAIGAIGRVDKVFDMPEDRTTGHSVRQNNKDLVIQFDKVSFGYSKETPVIKDLSFELYRDKMMALIGASGSGKSTIIDLLCGLYEHDEGKIQLFGIDIENSNLESIRDHIAVVSQDTYLFPGTIADNIMYGHKDATINNIIESATAAQAHEFISQMPNGYDTLLGEGGVNLSGGQKQRISIARAFLKNAPILLLDEPTSSLDNYSEILVQKSIDKLTKDRTVLVIAHRLSTITNADNILVLQEGRIIESGTHDELLKEGNYYNQLFNNQIVIGNDVKGEEVHYA